MDLAIVFKLTIVQKKKLEQRLALLMLEGLESGQSIVADANYWDAKRRVLTSEK